MHSAHRVCSAYSAMLFSPTTFLANHQPTFGRQKQAITHTQPKYTFQGISLEGDRQALQRLLGVEIAEPSHPSERTGTKPLTKQQTHSQGAKKGTRTPGPLKLFERTLARYQSALTANDTKKAARLREQIAVMKQEFETTPSHFGPTKSSSSRVHNLFA